MTSTRAFRMRHHVLWCALLWQAIAQAGPTLDQSTLSFGTISVGAISAPQEIRVRASTDTITSVVAASIDRFEVMNQCAPPIESGDECTLLVRFTPEKAEPSDSALTIEVTTRCDNTADCVFPLTATLRGAGRSPVVAKDDTASTNAGQAVTIPVLSNDDGVGIAIVSTTNASQGTVAIRGETIVYTPRVNAAGADGFSYRISDGVGTSGAVVAIQIAPSGAPIATEDSVSTVIGAPVAINVLSNDSGTGIRLVEVGAPAHGTAVASGDSVVYTPNANYIGTDRFTYSTVDVFGRTTSGTVSISVTKTPVDPQTEGLQKAATSSAAKAIVPALVAGNEDATEAFRKQSAALVAAGNTPEVGNALEQIAPKMANVAALSSQTTSQAQMANIRSRLFTLRANTSLMDIDLDDLSIQRGGWTLSGQKMRYLMASTQGGAAPNAVEEAKRNSNFGIFVNGTVDFGDKDQTSRQNAFDFDTKAVTAGLDYRFTENFTLGTALSYTTTNSELNDSTGVLDTKGYGISLYGLYRFTDAWYIDAVGSFTAYDYDQERRVVYDLPNVNVRQDLLSQYVGGHAFGDIGTGYRFSFGNLSFTPELRFSRARAYVSEILESPRNLEEDGSWRVYLDKQDISSYTTTLSGRLAYLWNVSSMTLQPHIEVGWLRETGDTARSVKGYFPDGGGDANDVFVLELDPVDPDYFKMEVGIVAHFAWGGSALFQYRTLFGYDNLRDSGMMAQLRWEF